ncbi:hypothetical protein QBC34DRAFT_137369 [Podospora aff. communis PSN243]|uniref:IBR domain-containing protein n=1 Tax=Podospora aff. communis PSN243 TaxID=3040156 RepID=A0AAV9H426_9PEZI|nr:hypothetical protein QBC34DRAFT_137369 [Podospora aff. communis PSN243]
MPSVAQESPSAVQCKKRRRENIEHIHSNITTAGQVPLFTGHFAKPISSHDDIFYGALDQPDTTSPINLRSIPPEKPFEHGPLYHHHHHHHQHHSSPLVRKIIPLPPSKRQRVVDDEDIRSLDEQLMRRPLSSPSQPKQLQEKSVNTRSTTPSRTATPSAKLMSRCHICGRKPAKKSDSDSFADCQGCSQRTCYVCIRECLGWQGGATPNQERADGNGMLLGGDSRGSRQSESPKSDASFTMADACDMLQDSTDHHHNNHPIDEERLHKAQESDGWARGGHRQVVCSQCCVERGANGDVVCLGCLAFIEG